MSSDPILHDTELGSVLFVDMVKSTEYPIEQRAARQTLLQTIVQNCAKSILARTPDNVITITAGDGMALVFFRNPLLPVMCALEIGSALLQSSDLTVRMGVNMGPVFRHVNIKEQVDVLGGGIDMAQRVMDLGDGGHILVSHNVAEVLEQTEWRECLRDLGAHQDKNGKPVHVYNLWKDGVGNPETPRKIRVTVEMLPPGTTPPKVGAGSRRKWIWLGSIVAVLAGGGFLLYRTGIIHLGPTAEMPGQADSTKTSPMGPKSEPVAVTVADAAQFYIPLDDEVPADGSGSQTPSFTAREDLKIGDTVVMVKGAKVSGSIVWAKKILMWGKKMTFRLIQADAVDGQKLKVRATEKHDGKADSRPFDTGKGPKSKQLAAAKGTEYTGYIDGNQTVSVRK